MLFYHLLAASSPTGQDALAGRPVLPTRAVPDALFPTPLDAVRERVRTFAQMGADPTLGETLVVEYEADLSQKDRNGAHPGTFVRVVGRLADAATAEEAVAGMA
jgi:hypothetical protein